jgi:opacity protein-like surface antigen
LIGWRGPEDGTGASPPIAPLLFNEGSTPMTQILTKLTLSAALLFAGAAVATAADMSDGAPGGIKDYRGAAVPVPVPVPYEETHKYYMGGLIGYSFARQGKTSGYFDDGTGTRTPIDTIPMSDFVGPASVSILFGRYLTPSLRVDLSMDFRSSNKVSNQIKSNYNIRMYEAGRDKTVTEVIGFDSTGAPVTLVTYTGPSQNYNVYNVEHSEVSSTQAHSFLINASYDLTSIGKFKPYIGAGVGFAVHTLDRRTTDVGKCENGIGGGSDRTHGGWNDIDDTYGIRQAGTCWNSEKLPSQFTNTNSKVTSGVGLAAALMAGATYSLSPRTHLDMNYRLMWMGGRVLSSAPLAPADIYNKAFTMLEVGNRLDHEIRTGLRFDLW